MSTAMAVIESRQGPLPHMPRSIDQNPKRVMYCVAACHALDANKALTLSGYKQLVERIKSHGSAVITLLISTPTGPWLS
jgi:hypothetical protein